MNLLPRPLRVSRGAMARALAGIIGLALAGTFFLALGGHELAAGEPDSWAGVVLGAAAFVPIVLIARWMRALRRLAADGEEVIGVLLDLEKSEHFNPHAFRKERVRRYRFVVDGAELKHNIGDERFDRPLFLDAEHTRALCVRSRAFPSLIRVVRNDFEPFGLSIAEQRVVRERIDELRELAKR